MKEKVTQTYLVCKGSSTPWSSCSSSGSQGCPMENNHLPLTIPMVRSPNFITENPINLRSGNIMESNLCGGPPEQNEETTRRDMLRPMLLQKLCTFSLLLGLAWLASCC